MALRYYLSRFVPNDPDPSFFDSVETVLDRSSARGIDLLFVDQRDLSPYARRWRWATAVSEQAEVSVFDDLTVGSRTIVIRANSTHFSGLCRDVEQTMAIEPYAEVLGKAAEDRSSAAFLLRACCASPRPPTHELIGMVVAALRDETDEMRYRAVSAAVTLQSLELRDEMSARIEHELDPEIVERLRRGVDSFEHAGLPEPGSR